MMRTVLRAGVVGVALLMGWGSAGADLSALNDPVWGNSSIVYDSTTGLDWLKPIHTTLESYQSIKSSLGAGLYAGWRYATKGDFSILLYDFDPRLAALLSQVPYGYTSDPSLVAGGLRFLDLFEPTISDRPFYYNTVPVGTATRVQGLLDQSGAIAAQTPWGSVGYLSPLAAPLNQPESLQWVAFSEAFGDPNILSSASPDFGSWLVRKHGQQSSTSKLYGLFIGFRDDSIGFRGDKAAADLATAFALRMGAEAHILTGNYSTGSLTKGVIKKQITRILNVMTARDRFFLYITTHGMPALFGNETTLTPGNERLILKDDWTEGVVPGDNSLSDNELTTVLAPYTYLQKYVMLDACYSGGFWGNYNHKDEGDLEKVAHTGLLAAAPENRETAAFSPNDTSQQKYPLITKALLDGFVRYRGFLRMDTNQNNIVSFQEMNAWLQNWPAKSEYTNQVVFEMDYGDAVLFTEDMWQPQAFATDDFDGNLRAQTTESPVRALIALSAPEGQRLLACTESGSSEIVLDGTASYGPEGELLTYTWRGPFGEVGGDVVTVAVPVGTHTITLTVDDENSDVDSATTEVGVEECKVNCDINGDGHFNGQDVSLFQKWCHAGSATWLCDVNRDGQHDGRDVAAYQKQCKTK